MTKEVSKSNDDDLKMFVAEIRKIGIDVCDCKKCSPSIIRLYNLAKKIVGTVDLTDIIIDASSYNEMQCRKRLEEFTVQIGACIYDPDYIYVRLSQVNSPKKNKDIKIQSELSVLNYFKHIIGKYYELLTPKEINEYGAVIICIKNIFIPIKCRNIGTFIKRRKKGDKRALINA